MATEYAKIKRHEANMEPKAYYCFRVGIVTKSVVGDCQAPVPTCTAPGYEYKSVRVVQPTKSFDVAQSKAREYFEGRGFKGIEVRDVVLETSTEAINEDYEHLIVG